MMQSAPGVVLRFRGVFGGGASSRLGPAGTSWRTLRPTVMASDPTPIAGVAASICFSRSEWRAWHRLLANSNLRLVWGLLGTGARHFHTDVSRWASRPPSEQGGKNNTNPDPEDPDKEQRERAMANTKFGKW